MMDLDVGICSEVEKKQKKKLLLDYLVDNLKHHNWWAYRYFFCETLALANVIGKSTFIYSAFESNFVPRSAMDDYSILHINSQLF